MNLLPEFFHRVKKVLEPKKNRELDHAVLTLQNFVGMDPATIRNAGYVCESIRREFADVPIGDMPPGSVLVPITVVTEEANPILQEDFGIEASLLPLAAIYIGDEVDNTGRIRQISLLVPSIQQNSVEAFEESRGLTPEESLRVLIEDTTASYPQIYTVGKECPPVTSFPLAGIDVYQRSVTVKGRSPDQPQPTVVPVFERRS